MRSVALVTGGGRGIGLAIARRLVGDGSAVSILDVLDEPAEALAELRALGGDEVCARYVRGSVAEPSDHRRYLDDAVDAWGRLDVLVNNAGVAPAARADLLDATPESFDRVLGINLRGPYFLTQAFARRVIELRGDVDGVPDRPVATVVNVSSISATAVSTNRGEYCISKAGVSMATRLFAVRLAREGIAVHEVRPGVIVTDMTTAATARYDALFAEGGAPIARWGRPEDVADAVGLLASGRLAYSTGEVVNVDGGMGIPTL